MIIARITKPNCGFLFHGSVEILGSPAEDDYRMKGWFPIDSFDFKPTGESEAKDQADAAPTAARTNSRAGSAGANRTPANREGEKYSKMRLSKEVDRATSELMKLSLMERGKEKGLDKQKELHADIHVLSSVKFKAGEERHVFPNLMVHLEGVKVVDWNVNGSGDTRPQESVTLQYDKSAMAYTWYDGTQFIPYPARGWDQKVNDDWTPPNLMDVFDKYRPQQ